MLHISRVCLTEVRNYNLERKYYFHYSKRFLCVTVDTLPIENKVCMAYAVFLSVILDHESGKTYKIRIHKKCVKNMPSCSNFAKLAVLAQT